MAGEGNNKIGETGKRGRRVAWNERGGQVSAGGGGGRSGWPVKRGSLYTKLMRPDGPFRYLSGGQIHQLTCPLGRWVLR
jgi:hypothetical protein